MRLLAVLIVGVFAISCGQEQPVETPVIEVITAPEKIDVEEHYESGVLKIKGLSVDGNREGLWQSYFKNGYKWSEVEYDGGIKNGDVVVFYQNGMMRYQGRYYDDARSGLWTFYDTLGVVLKKVNMDEVRLNPDSLLNP